MKKIALFTISLLIWRISTAQKPNATIVNPTSYSLSDSVLSIHVLVGSTYAISSVTATVNGRQALLTRKGVYYDGTLSLSGFNEDTLMVKVVVIDVMNNSDSAEAPFIYDKLPLLALTAPLNNSVARPVISVKAGCANKDTCTIQVCAIDGYSDTIYNGRFIDTVNTTIDLSRAEGDMVNLRFTITDKRGRKSSTFGGDVFVESSPYLTRVFEGNDLILDFNYGKALMSGMGIGISNDPSSRPTSIVDIQTLDSVIIPYNLILQPAQTFLTPFGAIFQTKSPSNTDQVMDWNSNNLNLVGAASGLQTAGNYAIFTGNFTVGGVPKSGFLGLRDLATQTNASVSTPQQAGQQIGSLSSNGYVAYSANDGGYLNVFYYKNGTTQAIMNDVTYGISDIVLSSDSINILYDQLDIVTDTSILHLYDGHKDTVLSNLGVNAFASSSGLYPISQANNNSLVFLKNDNNGIPQLWLKDSLGNYTATTSYSTNNGMPPNLRLDLLNPSGDFTFYKTNWPNAMTPAIRRYIRKNNQLQEICSGFGLSALSRTFYRDSSWYISIGRELFRIDLNIDADRVTSSEISVKKDSVYAFSTAGFVENYTGHGQLINLMINSLPGNGRLLLNGQPITSNKVIARSDLGQLSYLPDAGFTGVDSFAWNGSNGINYASATAYVKINVTSASAPPQPLLSVIQTIYCSNQGNQKIKINNLPAAANGTRSLVKLDAMVLPIAADSSFSFNVDVLTAGTHTISIVYSNAAAADTTTESFNVVDAVTPIVKVTASDTIVTSISQVITITATNIAGGGDDPQYIFASDRAFLNVLQQNSKNNTLAIEPTVLSLGGSWIYAKMTTSAACYAVETSLDSIRILRNSTVGLSDPDSSNQAVNVFPNPFSHQLTIRGLQAAKTYSVTLADMNGREVYSHRIVNKGQWQSDYLQVPKGLYTLRLYDETNRKVLSVIKLLSVE